MSVYFNDIKINKISMQGIRYLCDYENDCLPSIVLFQLIKLYDNWK